MQYVKWHLKTTQGAPSEIWPRAPNWLEPALVPPREQHLVLSITEAMFAAWCSLTLLTLSALSFDLSLTGEASYMDWECDWKVLSQSCGDQSQGNDKWHTNTHAHTYCIKSTVSYCLQLLYRPSTQTYCSIHDAYVSMDCQPPSVWCLESRL